MKQVLKVALVIVLGATVADARKSLGRLGGIGIDLTNEIPMPRGHGPQVSETERIINTVNLTPEKAKLEKNDDDGFLQG